MGKVNETIKHAICEVTKELNLAQYPTIQMDEENKSYVMAASGKVYTQGFFNSKTVVKTECNYILSINKGTTLRMMKRYARLFGNSKVKYDFLYLIICHDLRHMWQFQEQFQVGEHYDDFNLTGMFHGHGSSDVETDANYWMIQKGIEKGIGSLAKFFEMEQCSDGISNKFDKEFRKELKGRFLEALKDYNKLYYVIFRIILF